MKVVAPGGAAYESLDRVLPKTTARLNALASGRAYSATGAALIVHINGQRHGAFVGKTATGDDMTPESIFRLGCALKCATSLAITTLASDGQLSLTAPVADFVPEFRGGGKEEISIFHLLTHTSGLYERPGTAIDGFPKQILRAACKSTLPPGWRPGFQASYSVWMAWQLLGEVVQRATSVALRDFLKEHVLSPGEDIWIGMDEREYELLKDRIQPFGAAWDWDREVVPLWEQQHPYLCTQVLPGSGGYATLGGVVTLFERLMHADGQAEAMVTGITRPQLPDLRDGSFGGYGLGVRIGLADYGLSRYCSRASFGHSGLFRTVQVVADPELDIVIGVLFGEIHKDKDSATHRLRVVVDSAYRELIGLD